MKKLIYILLIVGTAAQAQTYYTLPNGKYVFVNGNMGIPPGNVETSIPLYFNDFDRTPGLKYTDALMDIDYGPGSVEFEGSFYVSLIDNNSWSPTAYPSGWILQ